MRFTTRLSCSAVLAFLSECIYAGYIRGLSHDWILVAVLLSFVLPLIAYVGTCWVIDDKCWKRRWGIIFSASIGDAVGTWVIMTVGRVWN